MDQEMRASAREKLALRVQLADGTIGITRDVSASGIYLLVPPGTVVDPWVSFELDIPEANLKFIASGEVVRTEPLPDGIGISLKLHQPRLIPMTEPSVVHV